MLENGFLIPCGTIGVDLGWIAEGRKLTEFEQKPWAIAHGFEQGGKSWKSLQTTWNAAWAIAHGWIGEGRKLNRADFGKSWEIAPNFLKRRLSAWKWISNTFRDYRLWKNGFPMVLNRDLQVLQIAPNFLKRSQVLENGFLIPCGTIVSIWGELARVENWPILSKSPGL